MPIRNPLEPFKPIEITSPILGLNDTIPIDGQQPQAATLAENVDFDRGTIANRRGREQWGDQIGWEPCWGGYEFRHRNGTVEHLRVVGTKLFKDIGAGWVGAISGLV